MFHRTVNHDEIRQWVESHGGRPTSLRAIDGELGVVRFHFGADSAAEPLDWDEFFQAFEQRKLAFVYADEVAPGAEQSMTRLVNRGAFMPSQDQGLETKIA